MAKGNKRKKALFNLFSQNLEWVKQHPSIAFKPDFSHGYICPLCFDVFFDKDLSSVVKNPLTVEDIPPVSLGGKPIALTCKNCNSKSGHKLDVHLLNRLLEIDSHSFLPNSKTKAKFEVNGNTVNGTFEVDDSGVVKMNLLPSHSNPVQAERFMSDMFPPRTIYNPLFYPEKMFDNGYESPTFNVKFNETSNERRAQVALLRIGYLIAFAVLGNGFLINGNLFKVREQILKPDEQILPEVFWVNREFPEETEGINIVTLPKELRCFLVIFRLKTPSQSRQFAVILPGPSEPGLQVYDFLNEERTVETFGWMEHINTRDFLRRKEHTFTSHWCWQEYTKDSYRPRVRPASDNA
ncbi:hypothetical protein EJV47_04635 [Hymenobacter gummosus]|uniref:HNH endonuclease 5 domain-containing protein n=1 Tax=Hymenobacter gummosus TaxID=1776032 RepID=A0A431U742_9BACT|nr:hypothetical protein [Hymenobacter gummosus]RTQ52313.1 hypothetical protein EJV47_04635 [Hymenobacter gummosus]